MKQLICVSHHASLTLRSFQTPQQRSTEKVHPCCVCSLWLCVQSWRNIATAGRIPTKESSPAFFFLLLTEEQNFWKGLFASENSWTIEKHKKGEGRSGWGENVLRIVLKWRACLVLKPRDLTPQWVEGEVIFWVPIL